MQALSDHRITEVFLNVEAREFPFQHVPSVGGSQSRPEPAKIRHRVRPKVRPDSQPHRPHHAAHPLGDAAARVQRYGQPRLADRRLVLAVPAQQTHRGVGPGDLEPFFRLVERQGCAQVVVDLGDEQDLRLDRHGCDRTEFLQGIFLLCSEGLGVEEHAQRVVEDRGW